MNITVRTYRSGFLCRPDTTWERENKDFYSPAFVQSIFYTPAVFARVSKAGKCIARKFASRYYDGMNFGMLLYPDLSGAGRGNAAGLQPGIPQVASAHGLVNDLPANIAAASIMDHTSYLPFPMYLPAVFETAGNIFSIMKDGKTVFHTGTGGQKDFIGMIEECIAGASALVSQRIGDIVAVELAAPTELVGTNEERAEISASFCENELFRLSIIK